MEWIALAWKYRNEIAIGLIILVLVLAGLYIKSVFKDRDNLKEQLEIVKLDLEAVKKQVKLNEDIANAIRKIKIQSNNYVSVVETTPSPAAGSVFVAVPNGMFNPKVLLSSITFRNKSSSNAGTKDSTSK